MAIWKFGYEVVIYQNQTAFVVDRCFGKHNGASYFIQFESGVKKYVSESELQVHPNSDELSESHPGISDVR
ncbi:hypothetical protein ACE1CD_15645 [Aerosakkonema sp. BLCC-F183]|uniref:hypothetical protein n=1 Tax=Aerosakkonema sp. BLCC-F183 TaxID=3342834 RepID=UPI0035BAE787